jgi:hypothetical protein
MNIPQWSQFAQQLMLSNNFPDQILTVENFLDYADRLRDILLGLPRSAQQTPQIKEFAFTLRRLRDDFEDEVTADPMCVYKPKHAIAAAAHKSLALTRYYYGAFRTSKTSFGQAEIYWTLTGQHPFWPPAPQPAQCAIVGVDYAHYGPMVFEAKYFDGEAGNPLSPVFPEGGKWLYRYDDRKKIAELACNACANAGKAQSCHHLKKKLILFSDEGDSQAMEGGQYARIQLDEQIDKSYYKVARNRVKTVKNSGIIITETPKKGRGFWTQKELVPLARSRAKLENSDIPLCECFHIDQFQAGLVPHAKIRASMEGMSESEIRVEIFGEPLVDLEAAVFDTDVLSLMRKNDVFEPTRGQLYLEVELEGEKILARDYGDKSQRQLLEVAGGDTTTAFTVMEKGELQVWRKPQKYTQYIIGADVSHGLTGRDFSCADVLAMTPIGSGVIQMEQEAQYYAHINPMQYAEELFKLGLFYSNPPHYYPWLVVERNGPGLEVIQCLIDMGCWFIFQDVTSGAQVKFQLQNRYGVGTTLASKPVLISVLQGVVRAYRHGTQALILHSEDSIDELESYIQEETEKKNVRFTAESGSFDDRVMSLGVASYAVRSFPLFNWELHAQWKEERARAIAEETKEPRSENSVRFWKSINEERDAVRKAREDQAYLEQLEEEYYDDYYDDDYRPDYELDY